MRRFLSEIQKLIKSDRPIILACCILFLLLPWLESSGKSLGYFLLLIAGGYVGIFIGWRKIKFDFLEILFILFLFFASISTILSSHKANSFLELLKYISFFFFFIAIRRLDQGDNRQLQNIFVVSIIINSLIFTLLSIINILPLPFDILPGSVYNFFYPAFGHNDLCAILLFAIPISFFIQLQPRKHQFLPAWLILILFLVGFLLSFSKSAYLTLIIISFLISKYLEKTNRLSKNAGRIMHLFAISAAVFYIFIIGNSYIWRIKDRPFYNQIRKPLYRDWRWKYMGVSLQSLSEKPLVGIGLDNFRFAAKKFLEKPSDWSDHGENYYITIFTETGIFGGAAMILLVLVSNFKVYRSLYVCKNYISAGITFGLLASSINVIAASDWYYLSLFFFYWTGTALMIPVKRSNIIS